VWLEEEDAANMHSTCAADDHLRAECCGLFSFCSKLKKKKEVDLPLVFLLSPINTALAF
jgi:cobyrinic acid a,c-diamide synthase